MTKEDIRKHKNKIVSGLIIIFLSAISFVVKNALSNQKENKSDTLKTTVQQPIINAISKDSSKQTNNQIIQTNQNKGDVNNEFVSGDKVINNKTVIVKQEKEKPKQRVVNKSDIDKIIQTIPKDFLIELEYSFSNKECETFGIAIANKLAELNYNFTRSVYGQLITNTYDERLEIRLDEPNKKAEILIHVLQEK